MLNQLILCSFVITATFIVTGCNSQQGADVTPSPASQPAASMPAASQPAALQQGGSAEVEAAPHGRVLGAGTFTGMNGHVSSGRVSLLERNGDFYIRMGEDFQFDSAPLPIVALGKNGYKKETATEKLKQNSGVSEYKLPEGIIAEDYKEVIIWCEKFSVPIALAPLQK
ncbi:MAG: DM13 domain-containing protein [Sumerlaeia bacterium]